MNIAWGRGDRLELQVDGGELYRSVEPSSRRSRAKTERLDGDNGGTSVMFASVSSWVTSVMFASVSSE